MLASIRPQSHTRYRLLPILGAVLDEFTTWSNRRGYALGTIRNQLKDSRLIDAYLQKGGARGLHDLTHGSFESAWGHFCQRRPSTAGTIRQIERFIEETMGLQALPTKPKSLIDLELERFSDYLHHVRGLEFSTIQHHCKYVQGFLEFLGWEVNPTPLTQVTLIDLEKFVRILAGRLNRYSLQHVIGYVRAFLRFQYEQGILKSPLHTMVDTPRIYRLERLPRHLPWETVKQLLHSIDRTDFFGWRDYAMLHLVAGYGLRSCEVVSLTLDDIDWRTRIFRIPQRKTGNQLTLPLTDAAGDVLVHYLQKRNPELPYRELFLRVRAPLGILKPTAVAEAFQHRARLSGLGILDQGSHCLRHSYAVHLLRQGASVKAIGDLLGHRDAESTGVYLRLATEDLRTIALPMPPGSRVGPPVVLGATKPQPTIKDPATSKRAQPCASAPSSITHEIDDYLALKRSLGRRFSNEAAVLHNLDVFVASFGLPPADLSGDLFNRWAATLERLSPTVRRNWMRIVRNFCLYRQRSFPGAFVPDPLTFPTNHQSSQPRIISESDVARLLAATEHLRPSPRSPLRSENLRVGILLLYSAGLRRGELLRLTLGDFNLNEGTLLIRATKFHKTRVIPLSASVSAELCAYLAVRHQSRLPMEAASALIWHGQRGGRGYTGTGFAQNWLVLCRALKIFTTKGKPPRIHDLRHSFAVQALKRCYLKGEDVQAKLPLLSLYMGHVSVASTHYYLPFVEELRSEASDRFHQSFGWRLFSAFEEPISPGGGER
jgi:integrase/recombinase XerD